MKDTASKRMALLMTIVMVFTMLGGMVTHAEDVVYPPGITQTETSAEQDTNDSSLESPEIELAPGESLGLPIPDGYKAGVLEPTEEESALFQENISDQATPQRSSFAAVSAAMPDNVDNSQYDWFPAIGNQYSVGSCTAFATTYYQLTSTVAKEYGWRAKYSPQYRFSPSFLYNIGNGGVDSGLSLEKAYTLMRDHGGALWNDMPYQNDYWSWPSNASIWRNALPYRIDYSSFIIASEQTPITGPKDLDLNLLKSRLNNGQCVVVQTDMYDLVYKRNELGKNTVIRRVDNPAMQGPHAITIVGYDDNVGVDIDNDGVISENEKGVFKLANSYGPTWEDNGYFYVSYDALNSISSIPNQDDSNRIGVFSPSAYVNRNTFYTMTLKEMNYVPKATAEITFSHNSREQVQFQLATSYSNIPSSTRTPALFASSRPALYEVDQPLTNYTIVLDYGILSGYGSNYFIKASDVYNDDKALTIHNFKVVNQTGSSIYSDTAFPVSLNNSTQQFAAQPIWSYPIFENDFEDLPNSTIPTSSGGWGWAAPYQYWHNDFANMDISIDTDSETGNHALKLSNSARMKLYRWTDDNTAMKNETITHYFYEWDMLVSAFDDTWNIEPFLSLPRDKNGQIEGTTSYYGKLQPGTYAHIAVEVDKKANTYNLFVNGINVKRNVSFPQASTFRMFTITPENAGRPASYMLLDNFKVSTGIYSNAILPPAEPTDTVWFSNDFDSLNPTQIPATTGSMGWNGNYQLWWLDQRQSSYDSVSLASEAGRGQILNMKKYGSGVSPKILRVYRFTGDNIGPGSINNGETFTYEMDLRISADANSTHTWDIGFNSAEEFCSFSTDPNFNYTQNNKKRLYGFTANTWHRVAIEINQTYKTYTVLVDGVPMGGYSNANLGNISKIMFQCDNPNSYGVSTLSIDNVVAYPGGYRR